MQGIDGHGHESRPGPKIGSIPKNFWCVGRSWARVDMLVYDAWLENNDIGS